MQPPLSFVFENLVFGSSLHDPWALFSVPTHPYACLSRRAQREKFLALLAALQSVEADFQLLRVSASAPSAPLLKQPLAELDRAHRRAGRAYLRSQREALARLGGRRSYLFLALRLGEPARELGDSLSELVARLAKRPRPVDLLQRLGAAWERRMVRIGELERLRERADLIHARLATQLALRPAKSAELEWLVRRAFCRGLPEPLPEGRYGPPAATFECNGEAALAPLEGYLLRWGEGIVYHQARGLEIEGESGVSYQAQLVVGALPEEAFFPSARVELMSTLPEGLPFPIDLTLCARFIPNRLAVKMARRGIQDADQVLRAEDEGEQGASERGYRRSEAARELLHYLQSPNQPPLLRALLVVAVGAPSPSELERRVELVKRAFGEVVVYRPLGEQLNLFRHHFPGQLPHVRGYEDLLTCEQVAAMMPTASHRAGSRRGFYLGYVLDGSRQPLRFDLREGSRVDRNAAVLCVGALGSGKTTLVQKLKYEAFLLGARIVDCDPKGDHAFHKLPEVAPHVEEVAVKPAPALRGLLDPLRIAPPHLRQESATSFLRDLLGPAAKPAWEAALLRAVATVINRTREPGCGEVVRALQEGESEEVELAKTLAVYARSGLTQLAFAQAGQRNLPRLGGKQVTYISIRDLPGPEPGVARSERNQAERIGEQVVRLIALFAYALLGKEPVRLKVFAFDEGWRLLGDPVGRMLLSSLQRMGRSELAVPLISTQLLTDAMVGERDSLAGLLGATFVFGLRAVEEVGRALSLLGLEPERGALRRALLEFAAGRCLFRDHQGRIEAVQVELVPRLLAAFSRTKRPVGG